ncbi:hypothetical protein EMPS_00778 [Entomortierella parvispora]|uniref:GH16 domain-containing protein n=1 Tax=Entomortierella parvispora TaxID=205924 RepID=A0A9P3H2C3_9FUNG|nr:hypothetical protein EMPS_00778 [Entomortierella parvispora]
MDPKDIDYSHSRRSNITSPSSSLINLSQDYQTYTIEWLPDKLTWYINGKVIRQLLKSETNGTGTQYPDTPSQIQFSIWDGGLGDPATMEWAGGPTDWSSNRPTYQMWIDSVDVKCYSPLDTATWPPKDQGFQGFVNPLERDPTSPLAKDAIVLGDNAPTFSTLDRGGLHWGRFLGGGKSLIGGKYPIPTAKKSQASFSSRTPGWKMFWRPNSFLDIMISKSTGGGSGSGGAGRWEAMVVALSAIAIAFFGLA